MRVSIGLVGFGNVGRQFLQVLSERRQWLRTELSAEVSVCAVASSAGFVRDESGLDIGWIADFAMGGSRLSGYPGYVSADTRCPDAWMPRGGDLQVVVDASSSDLETGEPSLGRFRYALTHGCHVISLNKAPLVADFAGLARLADQAGLGLRYSGATAAGLPTLDTVLTGLAGSSVLLIEGILNATTNYVLTAMSDDALSYDEALARAQSLGLAETDPSRDMKGLDTACKILLLANAAMGASKSLSDVSIKGITGITHREVAYWALEQRTIKLVGRAVRENGDIVIQVEPSPIPNRDFLARIEGPRKGVRFVTDLFGEIVVAGGKGDLRAAAATAFKDLVNLIRALGPRPMLSHWSENLSLEPNA